MQFLLVYSMGKSKWRILTLAMNAIRRKESILLLLKREYMYLEEECKMEKPQMI